MAESTTQLRDRFETGQAALLERRSPDEQARLAMPTARVGQLLYRREGDAADLLVARRLLQRAAAESDGAAACDAGLALARLEAIDALDLVEAHGAASRALLRLHAGPRDADDPPASPTSDSPACREALTHLQHALAAHVRAEQSERTAGAAAAEDGAVPPMLERITFYGDGNSAAARVVLQLDAVPQITRGSAPADDNVPQRLWFDLAGVRVADAVPRSLPIEAGGLLRVRRGEPSPGVTRVVFDMTERAGHRVFFLTQPYRIIVDFSAQRAPAAAPVVAGQPHPARVIVLDPGHGGREFGATNGRLRESRLALDIARRAAASLQRLLPGVRILLTRNDDVTVSLEERTAMANAVGADLFVSIHLNDGEGTIRHGGVTTFILDTEGSAQALRLAARENGTSTDEVTGLQRLLAGLHRREQVAASRQLAERVHSGTLARGRNVLPTLGDRGVQTATFHVLVGASMPAVLLEASFISQPDEAVALRTERYRQALADGMAAGIIRFVRGG